MTLPEKLARSKEFDNEEVAIIAMALGIATEEYKRGNPVVVQLVAFTSIAADCDVADRLISDQQAVLDRRANYSGGN